MAEPIPDREPSELKEIVQGIVSGEIYIAANPEEVQDHFLLVWMLAAKDSWPENLGALYEYQSKRAPNDAFMSAELLNTSDWRKVHAAWGEVREAQAKALEGAMKGGDAEQH